MLETLEAELAAALTSGDLEAARVAHEALVRLRATPEPVVDLASERKRRGRK